MNSIKGIFHDGIIEPIMKPDIDDPSEVLIIFPDSKKSIRKIGGLFQEHDIDYKQITDDLKELNKKSDIRILNKKIDE